MKILIFYRTIRIITIAIAANIISGRISGKSLFMKSLSVAISPQKFAQTTVKTLNKRLIDNFYTVEQGKCYRSAQLSPDQLEYYIGKYGIKTIINLRGENPDQAWWKAEVDVAQHNNVQLYNIAMSANELTPREKLLNLITIYDSAPTPILIHCRTGRDRTGEAAGIWVYEKMNGGNKKALKQLTLFPYQHSRLLHPAKSFLLRIWNGRNWLINEYDAANYPQFARQEKTRS